MIPRPTAGQSIMTLLIVFLSLCFAGCFSSALHVRAEEFRSDIDFKKVFGDNDVKQTRKVIEASSKIASFAEVFVDAGSASFRWDEAGPKPDGDGWAVGAGAQAAKPESPGPGIDWRVRFGYMSTNENMSINGFPTNFDFKGWDTDLTLCGYHAFSLGPKWLVAPCLGAFYKAQDGRMYMSGSLNAPGSNHTSYEFTSLGTYAGFKTFSTGDMGLSVTGGIYAGTADTRGWVFSAGILF